MINLVVVVGVGEVHEKVCAVIVGSVPNISFFMTTVL